MFVSASSLKWLINFFAENLFSTKSLLLTFYSRWRHCTQNATQRRETGEMSAGRQLIPPVPLMYFYLVYFYCLSTTNGASCVVAGSRSELPVPLERWQNASEHVLTWVSGDFYSPTYLFIYLNNGHLCNPLIITHYVSASLNNDFKEHSFIFINIRHFKGSCAEMKSAADMQKKHWNCSCL